MNGEGQVSPGFDLEVRAEAKEDVSVRREKVGFELTAKKIASASTGHELFQLNSALTTGEAVQ